MTDETWIKRFWPGAKRCEASYRKPKSGRCLCHATFRRGGMWVCTNHQMRFDRGHPVDRFR